jgi:hypothetical protein
VTRAKTSRIDRFGMSQIWLGQAGVDGRDVVGAGGRGVILEAETRLKATGEELVRNRSTCQWVQDKISVQAAVPQGRAGAYAHKNLMDRRKMLRLLFKKFPEG